MRFPLAILVTLLSTSIYAEVVAFIGHPVSASISKKTCLDFSEPVDPAAKLESVCLSRAFELRYGVQEAILGSLEPKEIIDFVGFYHYSGLPEYTSYGPAFVVVEKKNEVFLLEQIEYVEKKDGEWFYCEKMSDSSEYECLEEMMVKEAIKERQREM